MTGRTVDQRPAEALPTPDIDHQAMQELVDTARRLSRQRYDQRAVAAVSNDLVRAVRDLTHVCDHIIDILPNSAPGRPRLRIEVRLARDTLLRGPGRGETAALVHMQLLAGSVSYLSHAVQQAARSGVGPHAHLRLEGASGQQEAQR